MPKNRDSRVVTENPVIGLGEIGEKLVMDPQKLKLESLVESMGLKTYTVRGYRVMLDSDVAEVFRIKVSRLNKAVGRNFKKFPDDFVFRLTTAEWNSLKPCVVLKEGKGHRKYLPHVFTWPGFFMASTILKSEAAVQMSILFVRSMLRSGKNRSPLRRIAELGKFLRLSIGS